MRGSRALACVLISILFSSVTYHSSAQTSKPNGETPSKTELKSSDSEMRPQIERYTVDRGSLTRAFPVPMSPSRRDRFKQFYSDWLASLTKVDFDHMSEDGQIDYILFKNHLEYELRQLEIQSRQIDEIQSLIPFAKSIIDLEETRRRMEPIDSAKVAATLTELRKAVDERRRAVEAGLRPEGRSGATSEVEPLKVKKTLANRGVNALTNLRTILRNWYTFYNGYDPMFTWWNEEPYKALDPRMLGSPVRLLISDQKRWTNLKAKYAIATSTTRRPLCSQCLCGGIVGHISTHRVTKTTKVAQSRTTNYLAS